MSAEEFWHGVPKLAQAYKEAALIQRENMYLAEWRTGIYIQEALISSSRFYREWSKGAEYNYPDRPLFGKSANRSEADLAKERMEKNIENFTRMMDAANAMFKERESAP